jgi:hypothetical protein
MDDRLELVHALVDGELDAETREHVAQLIATDPAMNREYLWTVALKETVAYKCQRIEAPASWEAAKARLREVERVKTVNYLVGKHAWGLCGVLFVAVLAAGAINRLGRSATVSAVQAAEIIRPFNTTSPSVTPEKSPFVLVNPQDGTELFRPYNNLAVLGRASYLVENRPVSQFGLRDPEGPMSLYIVRGVDRIEGVDEPVGYSDFRIGFINQRPSVSWQKDKSLMVLTADRSWDRLVETAKRLR